MADPLRTGAIFRISNPNVLRSPMPSHVVGAAGGAGSGSSAGSQAAQAASFSPPHCQQPPAALPGTADRAIASLTQQHASPFRAQAPAAAATSIRSPVAHQLLPQQQRDHDQRSALPSPVAASATSVADNAAAAAAAAPPAGGNSSGSVLRPTALSAGRRLRQPTNTAFEHLYLASPKPKVVSDLLL
jgi:hypothetical protein